MKRFLVLVLIVAALATGYVLGARAGRGRYREIRAGAEAFWSDPLVRRVRRRLAKKVQKARRAAARARV